MDENKLDELNRKLDQLLAQKNQAKKTPDWLHFIFQAALPIALGIIGFYFTNQFNEHQLEFQKIGVADNLMKEVMGDSNFNKEKLDLKLGFVQKVFDDRRFKDSVRSLLTQTFAVNFKEQATELAEKASTGDPAAMRSVQKQINTAKQFNDPSINKAVANVENTEPVRRINKAESLKQSAINDMRNGNVDSATVKLDEASQLLPKDTSTSHLANNLRKNREEFKRNPALLSNKGTTFTQQNNVPATSDTTVHKPRIVKKKK
ncbi:MAG: hypothetical protein H0W62_01075 [Chitinophagales bacterium]|nr:hypothetical protein [Chitinophagales bacterium]